MAHMEPKELNMINLTNAIREINSIEFDYPSEWLDVLKASAIECIQKNNGLSILDDDYSCCEMQPNEYKKFKKLIKDEMYFHEQWDMVNLEHEVVRRSKEYVDAWNHVLQILTEFEIKVPNSWYMVPTDPSVILNMFCHYDLPSDAIVGEEWKLPDWYIEGNNSPEAPWWKFSYPGFTAYIKAVKRTKDSDILEVEYQLYKSNDAHCSGYYARWCTGVAMVNIATHRRWNVD